MGYGALTLLCADVKFDAWHVDPRIKVCSELLQHPANGKTQLRSE